MTDYERKRYEDFKLAYAALMLCYPLEVTDLDGEIWRNIKGFEGHYQISNYGRVKSFKNSKIKILKPFIDKDGYFQVMLCNEFVKKKFKVHRLVAEPFIPNPENKETVNHIDGCKMNNFVENLEWNSQRENNCHALKVGLRKPHKGIGRKLTDEQAAWCRAVYISGDKEFGTSALARKLNISNPVIHNLLNYKTYKNVE